MSQVPKPQRKRKKKLSKLQKKKNNPLSSYWMNQADSLFKRIMHETWKREGIHYCFVCESGDYETHPSCAKVECAHLIPCENYLYRWDAKNVIPLGSYHHNFSRECSPHNAPVQFGIWLNKHYSYKSSFVEQNRNSITRKAELPFTFEEKYLELLQLAKELKIEGV